MKWEFYLLEQQQEEELFFEEEEMFPEMGYPDEYYERPDYSYNREI